MHVWQIAHINMHDVIFFIFTPSIDFFDISGPWILLLWYILCVHGVLISIILSTVMQCFTSSLQNFDNGFECIICFILIGFDYQRFCHKTLYCLQLTTPLHSLCSLVQVTNADRCIKIIIQNIFGFCFNKNQCHLTQNVLSFLQLINTDGT